MNTQHMIILEAKKPEFPDIIANPASFSCGRMSKR